MKIGIIQEFGKLEAVAFFVKGDLAKIAHELKVGSRAHLLAHIERDQFSQFGRAGKSQPRLRLLDIVLA